MFNKLLILITISTIIVSCEKANDNSQNGNVTKNPALIAELNAKSSDTIMIGTKKYFLNASLWRDFMPVSPSDGRPLISVSRLIDQDSIAIPSNIQLIEQYVIYNDSIWIDSYENISGITPAYMIEKTLSNGPKWGPDIYVDIISKVKDTNTSTDYFIRVKGIKIDRTD
jgi:hypothetical protein